MVNHHCGGHTFLKSSRLLTVMTWPPAHLHHSLLPHQVLQRQPHLSPFCPSHILRFWSLCCYGLCYSLCLDHPPVHFCQTNSFPSSGHSLNVTRKDFTDLLLVFPRQTFFHFFLETINIYHYIFVCIIHVSLAGLGMA